MSASQHDPGREEQLLLARLRDPDPIERGRAVDSLGQLGRPELARALHGLLDDSDPIVAFKAAAALAGLGDPGGLAKLLRALTVADLRSFALDALIDLGSSESVEALRRFLARPFLHPLEKMQAAAALSRAGDESGSDYIRRRLESRQPDERGFALELWGRLAMPDALDRLCEVLARTDDPHRLDAVRGLVHLGDRRALKALRSAAAQQDDPELAREAEQAAAWLRDAGRSSSAGSKWNRPLS
ncbi:MAG: HEAT repeat domain-containing protein [Deltaproteobacteria bacterium]|nr:HEAT repeat domain-containing protein [Deltaproteobacteria bacterium]